MLSNHCSTLPRSGARFIALLFLLPLLLIPDLRAQEKSGGDKLSPLRSGPQVGQRVVPYHPLLCNGAHAGQRWCMVCTHRGRENDMIIVFTRSQNSRVAELITAVEALTKKHQHLGGIVTFLTTKGKTAKEAEALTGAKVVYINDAEKKQFRTLRQLAEAKKIANSSLNIYTADGPEGYRLSPEAALTVIVANRNLQVKANVALRKSELTKERIAKIVRGLEKAIPAR